MIHIPHPSNAIPTIGAYGLLTIWHRHGWKLLNQAITSLGRTTKLKVKGAAVARFEK